MSISDSGIPSLENTLYGVFLIIWEMQFQNVHHQTLLFTFSYSYQVHTDISWDQTKSIFHATENRKIAKCLIWTANS